jgi:signal transduction histidine kinase
MGNKKKQKKYIPKQRRNTELLTRTLQKKVSKVDEIKNIFNALIKANEQHIIFLSNFLRHDMKNAIHSMDGILSTTEAEQITEENIQSLKTSLDILRQTLDNFTNVIPHSPTGEFQLVTLLTSLEALSRGYLNKNKIECVYDHDRQSTILINQSFQSLLQILHNLVINASKATETTALKKIYISATINDELCEIKIADTGIPIPQEDSEKIFSYGFSTTGGTGIGLFHAKYACDSVGGSINVNTKCNHPFTKEFIIKFPIKNKN